MNLCGSWEGQKAGSCKIHNKTSHSINFTSLDKNSLTPPESLWLFMCVIYEAVQIEMGFNKKKHLWVKQNNILNDIINSFAQGPE
jgi:hypothetical protein